MSKYSAKLMTEGSIWKRIVAFAIPLFWGNLFQQLYNTADSLIVGNFLGSSALAAVSSSGNLIFLMVGLFNGIAIGSGVIVAKYYGARDIPNLQKSIHTTVGFGLICGVILTIVGIIAAPQILVLMGTPEAVLPNSITYFRIYFTGSLAFVMYNFFVGILRHNIILGINHLQSCFVKIKLDYPAFIVDRTRSSIFNRLRHVVYIDIVAENFPRT